MQKPWYKQFWPWFLIALPVTVMCVCATIIYLSASQGGFSMVVDDYYKRGKMINAVIEHVEKAKNWESHLMSPLTTVSSRCNMRLDSLANSQHSRLSLSMQRNPLKILLVK